MGFFGFGRKVAKGAGSAAIPGGERVYAIGDVHGRLDLLTGLLDQVDRDDAGRGAARTRIVFLGDLVDRGPQSAQVIEHVLTRDWGGRPVTVLQGNHEEVFLLTLNNDLEATRFWLRIGGVETMESYGTPRDLIDHAGALDIAQDFIARVPDAHVAFLHKLAEAVTIGGYHFVHAGVRPGVALDRQKPEDLRWIRERFLDYEGSHGAMIVHGHSIALEVEELSNRIGIDTGAFHTGRLTAIGLEGTDRWFLQT